MRISAVCLNRVSPPRSAPALSFLSVWWSRVDDKTPKNCICLSFLPSGVDVRPILLEMLLFTEEKIELRTCCCEYSCLGKTRWKGILKYSTRLYGPRNTWGLASFVVFFKYLGVRQNRTGILLKAPFPFHFPQTVSVLGKFNLCILESFHRHSSKYCKVNTRSGFKTSLELSDKQLFPWSAKIKFCQLWMNPEPRAVGAYFSNYLPASVPGALYVSSVKQWWGQCFSRDKALKNGTCTFMGFSTGPPGAHLALPALKLSWCSHCPSFPSYSHAWCFWTSQSDLYLKLYFVHHGVLCINFHFQDIALKYSLPWWLSFVVPSYVLCLRHVPHLPHTRPLLTWLLGLPCPLHSVAPTKGAHGIWPNK